MLNHITIQGRLTRDPELRRTQSGIPVTSFTLAVDRDFKSQNGERETDFINCVAWRNTAEFVSKYFTKGRMAIVEGSLQIRKWEDNGARRESAEVIVNSAYFGDSKSDRQSGNGGGYGQPQGYGATPQGNGAQGGYGQPPSGNSGYGQGQEYRNAPIGDNFREIDNGAEDGDLPF